MKKLIAFILLLGLLFFMPACGKTGDAPADTEDSFESDSASASPAPEEIAEEKVPFEPDITYSEVKDSLLSPDGSGKTIFEYGCVFPVVKIAGYGGTETELNTLFSALEEDFCLGAESGYSKQNMEEMATDALVVYGDSFRPFSMQRDIHVLYINDGVVSFSVSDELYQGPESSFSDIFFRVYDIGEKKLLRFEDLGDSLLEEVAAWYYVSDDVMKTISAENDWYLNEEGIVITGFDSVQTLPYSEIEGAIKDKYLPRLSEGDPSQ